MELDDELTNLNLKKDINRFWQKWNAKFSVRNMKPSNVNGMTSDEDIATCFRIVFLLSVLIRTKINTRRINRVDNLAYM